MFFSIVAAIKGSDVYQQALAKLNANVEATNLLGAPVEPGLPMGSVRISGPSGDAELSIPVQGSKAKGTLYSQATKEMGQWRFDRIELEVDGREGRIDLNSGRTVLPRSRSEKQAARKPWMILVGRTGIEPVAPAV
ncbi:MAG: cytochrome c oxidase assembly factor Coa1 family protein [Usitatibacter sp.]